jgi:hypothetical protein
MRRAAAFALALTVLASACSTGPFAPEPVQVPLPANGPILYSCADGTQMTVTYRGDQALVAVVGGTSMNLPLAGHDFYTNGRYALRGVGASASWAVGRRAATACSGQ